MSFPIECHLPFVKAEFYGGWPPEGGGELTLEVFGHDPRDNPATDSPRVGEVHFLGTPEELRSVFFASIAALNRESGWCYEYAWNKAMQTFSDEARICLSHQPVSGEQRGLLSPQPTGLLKTDTGSPVCSTCGDTGYSQDSECRCAGDHCACGQERREVCRCSRAPQLVVAAMAVPDLETDLADVKF